MIYGEKILILTSNAEIYLGIVVFPYMVHHFTSKQLYIIFILDQVIYYYLLTVNLNKNLPVHKILAHCKVAYKFGRTRLWIRSRSILLEIPDPDPAS